MIAQGRVDPYNPSRRRGMLTARFPKFGAEFRTALLGPASCLSTKRWQARCRSQQYHGLGSSFVVSSPRRPPRITNWAT